MSAVAARRENFPCAALEEMASRSRLISTGRSGGNAVIEGGGNGALNPVRSAEPLGGRIGQLGQAVRTGAAAKRRCRDVCISEMAGRKSLAFCTEIPLRHDARS